MQLLPTAPRHLRNRLDVARALGLQPQATTAEISHAFGYATNFDAKLEFEEEQVQAVETEQWEVRVIQARPRCLVEVRPAARGAWLSSIDAVPADVQRFLQLRATREGRIETDRSWKAWQRMSWANAGGRRLRSRNGELVAFAIVPGVSRPTGEVRRRLRLEAFGTERPEEVAPIKLALPCALAELVGAAAFIREVCQARAMAA